MALSSSRGAFNAIVSVASLIFAAPIILIIFGALFSESQMFGYIWDNLFFRYLRSSLSLWLGVAICSTFIGVFMAWIVTAYSFPFRNLFKWLLFLPLAMPSYIAAMVYGYQLDVAGPLQRTLREVFDLRLGEYWFPEIYSLAGAVFILSITLYPYIYMLSLIAFRKQCGSYFESAQLLGVKRRQWLWRVALPVARPAIVVGIALVSMETLADFGVVSLYGIESFTTGIYRSWYGMADPYAAVKLAAILLALVSVFVLFEKYRGGRFKQEDLPIPAYAIDKRRTHFLVSLTLMVGCSLPFLLGFLLPVIQLVSWTLTDISMLYDEMHWYALRTTVLFTILVVITVLMVATLFAYGVRYPISRLNSLLIRAASFGYAIPGAVLAVAIFIGFIFLERAWVFIQLWLFSNEVNGVLVGSVLGVVLACSIRFMAVGVGAIESNLKLISTRMDESAMLLGSKRWQLFHHVHLPHLKSAYLLCAFAVFADTAKELPATLMLRPFDTTTLAIRSFELAQDGRIVTAAIPALMLVCLSSIAVGLFVYFDYQSNVSLRNKQVRSS